MAKTNQYGLSRDIPEPIKRAVRQRCGFGCVFCGLWIYEYEHILPQFKDAKEHDPDKICLLCPNHHEKVTKGIVSKKQVLEQYKNPRALEVGFASDYLVLDEKFSVVLGRIFLPYARDILSVEDNILIGVKQPSKSEPLRLYGKFFNDKGDLVMEIIDNEFRGLTSNWDVQQKGRRTIIKDNNKKICLKMLIEPPDILKIESVDMKYKGAVFNSDSKTGKIFVTAKNGAGIDFPNGQIITEGIKITETGLELNKAICIGVQKGLPFNEIDYKEYLKSGRVASKKTI